MPNEQPEKSLRRRIAKWTGIATSLSGCIAGIAVLSIQTCGEIRSAKSQATKSRVKAEAGYETLQPRQLELMSIAEEVGEWQDDTDEEIAELQEEIDSLREELQRHDVYFELLKERNRSLREAPRVTAVVSSELPEPWHSSKPTKVRASRPKLSAPPKDLDTAVQIQQQLLE